MGYQAKDLEFLLLKQKKIKKLIKSLVNTDLFAWGHPGGVMRSIFFNFTKPQLACLVDRGASFDTPGTHGGTSITEIYEF